MGNNMRAADNKPSKSTNTSPSSSPFTDILENMWRDSGIGGDLNIADDHDKIEEADQAIKAAIAHDIIGYDELAAPHSTVLEQAAISERNKFKREIRAKLGIEETPHA